MQPACDPRFSSLLDAVIERHRVMPVLSEFCPWPDDVAVQACAPFHVSAADAFLSEQLFCSDALDPLVALVRAVTDLAQWRETYKDSGLPQSFLDVFGTWCLVGAGGPFRSSRLAAYFLYMPSGLWYPWHHHPAEELYCVLAGSGEFYVAGQPAKTLSAGDTIQHGSNEPHALQTTKSPVLAYVVWRNGFGTRPVLTPENQIPAPLGSPHMAR